jgi:3-oxoacyl-[acyl-carrier protein] reductase
VLPGSTHTPRIEQIIAARAQKSGCSEQQVQQQMTAEIPLGRFADPAETAAVVAFLASPAAGYVTGVSLPVDGGRMHSL